MTGLVRRAALLFALILAVTVATAHVSAGLSETRAVADADPAAISPTESSIRPTLARQKSAARAERIRERSVKHRRLPLIDLAVLVGGTVMLTAMAWRVAAASHRLGVLLISVARAVRGPPLLASS